MRTRGANFLTVLFFLDTDNWILMSGGNPKFSIRITIKK